MGKTAEFRNISPRSRERLEGDVGAAFASDKMRRGEIYFLSPGVDFRTHYGFVLNPI